MSLDGHAFAMQHEPSRKLIAKAQAAGLLPDQRIREWSWRHGDDEISSITVTYLIDSKQLEDFLELENAK